MQSLWKQIYTRCQQSNHRRGMTESLCMSGNMRLMASVLYRSHPGDAKGSLGNRITPTWPKLKENTSRAIVGREEAISKESNPPECIDPSARRDPQPDGISEHRWCRFRMDGNKNYRQRPHCKPQTPDRLGSRVLTSIL